MKLALMILAISTLAHAQINYVSGNGWAGYRLQADNGGGRLHRGTGNRNHHSVNSIGGLEMAVVTLQVTLGASVTSISASPINCRWVLFQNNGANSMRLGDANISATRGVKLGSNSSFYAPVPTTELTNLAQWSAFGTQNDVLDVIYDLIG